MTAQRIAAYAKYAAKLITFIVGAASVAVTEGLFTGTAARWVEVGISVATGLGIFFVKNAPSPTPQPVPQPAPPVDAPPPVDPAHPFPPVGG